MSRYPADQRAALDQLARRNPVPVTADTAGSDPQTEDGLAKILATPRSVRAMTAPRTARKPLQLRMGLAAAASAAVVATLVVLPGSSNRAYAATPPMLVLHPTGASASALLDHLAALAAVSPAEPDVGRYDYLVTQGWGLNSAVSRSGTRSVVVPELTQVWSAPDGTGRWRVLHGEATLANGKLVITGGTDVQDAPLGSADVPLAVRVNLEQLSRDPKVLADQLLHTTGGLTYDPDTSSDPLALQRLRNILALHQQQVLPPSLNAALLHVLAHTPGVLDQGTVTDRVGRTGVAVSLDVTWGRPYRYLVILDPSTGALLDSEQIATTTYRAGEPEPLHVHIPAVVEYQAYLTAQHTTTTVG